MTRATHYLYIIAFVLAATASRAMATDGGNAPWPYRSMFTVQNLNTADGLSSGRVHSVAEAADGGIWIGTRRGVDRYDGQQVKNYRLHAAADYSNAAGCSYRVCIAADGTVSAYDNKGNIYRYSSATDRFVLLCDLSRREGHDVAVNELAASRDGSLWAATYEGVYRLAPDGSGRWVKRGIAALHVAHCGSRLLVGTSHGCAFIDPATLRMGRTVGSHSVISSWYDAAARRLWLGTFSHGIELYDLAAARHDATPTPTALVPNLPVRVLRLWRGKVMAGIDGAGIYACRRDAASASLLISTHGEEGQSLHGEGVYDIWVDRHCGLWVGTYTGGLDFVQLTAGELAFVHNEYLNPQSLMSNTVNAVCQTADGSLWFATDKGVSSYNPHTATWHHALQGHVVLTLCPRPGRLMLAGTYGNGVFCLDDKGRATPLYTKAGGQLRTDYVYTVFSDSGGDLWIGCLDGDLAHIDGAHTQYLPIREVQCVAESPDRRYVAVGTTHGGYLVNRATLRTRRFFHPAEFRGVDYNYFINTMLFLSPDVVLIGTDGGGIYRYSLSRHTVSNETTHQGLPSNVVTALVRDKGSVWVSTDRGVAVITRSKIQNASVAEGLEREYRRDAAMLTREGTLVFGSVDGAVLLDRRFALALDYKATLRIAGVEVEGMAADSAHAAAMHAMLLGRRLHLSHSDNTLTFSFECINHRYQRDIQYLYFLEGYDKQWSEATAYPKARYANLPPGSYTLHVKAISRSNGRTLGTQKLAVSIARPWWDSLWAWLVYVAATLWLAWMVWQYYRERLRQRYNDEKIRFFVNTAHNIRTPLSLVLAPLADIAADGSVTGRARQYTEMAMRNGRKLMSMVTELLDFEKSSARDTALRLRPVDLKAYIGAQTDKFGMVIGEKRITLSTDLPDRQLAAQADVAILDVVFENLVSNAVKYTPRGGTIVFGARAAGQRAELWVADSGIGIPEAERKKVFSNFFRASNAIESGEMGSGLGLALTRQLAARMKGQLRFESEEDHGTTFTLTLPLAEAAPQAAGGAAAAPADASAAPAADGAPTAVADSQAKDTLLFVDDNADLRQYVSMAFSQRYNVATAASGEEALHWLATGECDIVVSDVMMPGMTGDELCRRIKADADLSWLPVILLTARAGRTFEMEGLQTGADDFVPKPFDSAVLACRIDSMLANRRRLAAYYMKRSVDVLTGAEPEAAADEPTAAADEPEAPSDEPKAPSDEPTSTTTATPAGQRQPAEAQLPPTAAADREFIDRATRVVMGHMAETDFTIDSLCREMAMSRTLFYGRLKTLTGQAPQDFIRILRLEQAAVFLRQGDTVLDVSVKTGFANVKYFSTVFKKHFGVPPSKF